MGGGGGELSQELRNTLQFEVGVSMRRLRLCVSWKSHSLLRVKPSECQPLTAASQARVLLSCPAGPVPQPCWRGPVWPGNASTSHSVGLGACGCREDRSEPGRESHSIGGCSKGRTRSLEHQEAQKVLLPGPSLAQVLPDIASCPDKVSFLFPDASY